MALFSYLALIARSSSDMYLHLQNGEAHAFPASGMVRVSLFAVCAPRAYVPGLAFP